MKVTTATGVKRIPSVESSALKVVVAAVVEVTVKLATPDGLDVTDAGEMFTPAFGVPVKVTAFPATGSPAGFKSVTVITDEFVPFATTEPRDATTVERVGEGDRL